MVGTLSFVCSKGHESAFLRSKRRARARSVALLWVRETKDDPGSDPDWSDWERLESAEFDARAFEFQLLLSTEDSAFSIAVEEAAIEAETL